MVHLYEYINPKDKTVIIPTKELGVTPLQSAVKIDNVVKDFIDNYAKSEVVDLINQWFKDNPQRRNIKCGALIDATFYLTDDKNKLLNEVITELNRIGVFGEPGEFDVYDPKSNFEKGTHIGRSTMQFAISTAKQFKEGNYTYKEYISNSKIYFKDSSYGNGYNNLPVTDINILRRKLYDCMTNTSYEIISVPSHNFNGGLNLPHFEIILHAVYDKRKLKNLLNDLRNDKRLQNFAGVLDNSIKGIKAYYASKHSGAYTGD